jgi:hypothetical protein
VTQHDKHRGFALGLILALLATAPAPAEKAAEAPPLAEARYKAAVKQFGEVWVFYRQSRTDSFPVYYWSRLVLDSQRDLSHGRADRIAAAEGHLDRMRKLEALVRKVRKVGFGFSTDIGATEYYRLEAELWLEQAKKP